MLLPEAEIEPTKWDLYATELYHNTDHDDNDDDDDDDDDDNNDGNDENDEDDDEMVRNATRKAKKLQMGKSHSPAKEAFYRAAWEMLLAKSKNFA